MTAFHSTPYRPQLGDPPIGRFTLDIVDTCVISAGGDLKLHMLLLLPDHGLVFEQSLLLKTSAEKRRGTAARCAVTFYQICAVAMGMGVEALKLQGGVKLDYNDPTCLDELLLGTRFSGEFRQSKAGNAYLTDAKAVEP